MINPGVILNKLMSLPESSIPQSDTEGALLSGIILIGINRATTNRHFPVILGLKSNAISLFRLSLGALGPQSSKI